MPSPAPPAPQVQAIHAHLAWWFEKATRGFVEVGWVPQGQTSITKFKRFTLDAIRSGATAQFIADMNAVTGQNCYFRPALVAPPTDKPATDADFVESPGIWIDQDSPEQVKQGENVSSILQPQAWLVTGRTPSLRKQGFLKAESPITDPAVVRSLNSRLRALYGGDPSVVNPTRLMRVPATVNWPIKKGRTIAEQTEPVYPQTASPGYSLDQLQRLLPEEVKQEPKATEAQNTLADPTKPTAEELISRLKNPDELWHVYALRLVAHWVSRGWSDVEILGWAEQFTRPEATVEQTIAELQTMINGARRKWNLPDQDHTATNPIADAIKRFGENPLIIEQTEKSLHATPFSLQRMVSTPPRAWVYGHFLLRRFCSVLGAPGGAGKTSYAFGVALSVALGRPFLDEPVHEQGNVWIFNLEDPLDELDRRMWGALAGHNLTAEDQAVLEQRLFVDSGRDQELIVAAKDKFDNVSYTPHRDQMIAEIKRRNVKLIIVDPFLRSHRVEENRNEHLDYVMKTWAEIADQADCAVLLIHHFRKGGVSGDADAFRGGKALIDAVRAAVSLATMTQEEAKVLGVDPADHWQYVRMDNAKLNVAKRPDQTIWFHLDDIPLMNGENVGVIRRWYPTPPAAEQAVYTVQMCLKEIDAGVDGELFTRKMTRAKDRWGGAPIMKHFGCDEDGAKQQLNAWLQERVLAEVTYFNDKTGRKSSGLKVSWENSGEARAAVLVEEKEAKDESSGYAAPS